MFKKSEKQLKDCNAKNAADYLLKLDNLSRTFRHESPWFWNLRYNEEFRDHLWLELMLQQIDHTKAVSRYQRSQIQRRIGDLDVDVAVRINLADNIVMVYAALRHWNAVLANQHQYSQIFARRARQNQHHARDYLDAVEPEFKELLVAVRGCRDNHDCLERLATDVIKSLNGIALNLLLIAYHFKTKQLIQCSTFFDFAGESLLNTLADLRERCQPCRGLIIDSYPYEIEMSIYHGLIGTSDRRGWYDLYTDAIVEHKKYASAVAAVNAAIEETF